MLSLSCCYNLTHVMYKLCISICNIHINSFSSGTVWLRQVTCGDTYNCLSYCAGGSCPTSSVTCTEGVVAHVTCSE